MYSVVVVVIQVLRSGGLLEAVHLSWRTLGIHEDLGNLLNVPTVERRATPGKDFAAVANGSAIFSAGQNQLDLSIQLFDDTDPESLENIYVVLNTVRLLNFNTTGELILTVKHHSNALWLHVAWRFADVIPCFTIHSFLYRLSW